MSNEHTVARLRMELAFMYKKYQDLSEAYKRLANEKGSGEEKTKHDMSHMSFRDEEDHEKNN
jgi:hypothetical protein